MYTLLPSTPLLASLVARCLLFLIAMAFMILYLMNYAPQEEVSERIKLKTPNSVVGWKPHFFKLCFCMRSTTAGAKRLAGGSAGSRSHSTALSAPQQQGGSHLRLPLVAENEQEMSDNLD